MLWTAPPNPLRSRWPQWPDRDKVTQFSTFATAEFLLLMQWTAPATGIAMCQYFVALAATRESAVG